MKLIYKYKADHRVTIGQYFKLITRASFHKLGGYCTKPIISDIQPIFVAGCGHSGTTLISSRLGNHPEIFSIGRESGVFSPQKSPRISRAIVQEWHHIAEQIGATSILEKTPKHIHTVDRIKRMLPSVKVILTLRNPLDNCASLYQRFADLEYSVERWMIDNEELLFLSEMDWVQVVKYEEFITRPELLIDEICPFLNLACDEKIIHGGDTVYSRTDFKGNMAIRKEQVTKEIYSNIEKWKNVFSDSQASYVIQKTKKLANKLSYRLP